MPIPDFEAEDKLMELLTVEIAGRLGDQYSEIISEVIFDKFCMISLMKEENGAIAFITINDIDEGGRSLKLGNLVLNWKDLLFDGVEGYVTIAGALATPYLIPLAALCICRKIFKASQIHLQPLHAQTMIALWRLEEVANTRFKAVDLFVSLSPYFEPSEYANLNNQKFMNILEDLKKLRCIAYNSDGSISLIEKAEIPISA